MQNKFRPTNCRFCGFDGRNIQLIAFCKSRNLILQEKSTVEFSNVLLKSILVPCEHWCYTQNHAQPSFFREAANSV